jgi:hypothetical protein
MVEAAIKNQLKGMGRIRLMQRCQVNIGMKGFIGA